MCSTGLLLDGVLTQKTSRNISIFIVAIDFVHGYLLYPLGSQREGDCAVFVRTSFEWMDSQRL